MATVSASYYLWKILLSTFLCPITFIRIMHLVYGGPLNAQPKLLDQVRDRLRLKHYSLRTEESYGHWIKRFI